MGILWLKVSDEVEIPACLTAEEQRSLSSVFDSLAPSSPWSKALLSLGMSMPPGDATVLRFVEGAPYFNGTTLALVSSHGTVYPVEEKGAVVYRTRLGVFGLLRVLASQWKLERFLSRDDVIREPLEESIALGLAIQALMLRLPSKGEAELASWLANPAACPPASRTTVVKILTLQSKRNSLSPHWNALFKTAGDVRKLKTELQLPSFFWDEPPLQAVSIPAPTANESAAPGATQSWKGIPVCGGQIEGFLTWVESDNSLEMTNREGVSVLAFPRARPETTELFSSASGLLFAEGGALSHACSIARERGIPCVSGLGKTFTAAIRSWKASGISVWVTLDGGTGEVSCTPKIK